LPLYSQSKAGAGRVSHFLRPRGDALARPMPPRLEITIYIGLLGLSQTEKSAGRQKLSGQNAC